MSHEYRMEQLRAAIAAARKNFKKDANFFVVGLTYGCLNSCNLILFKPAFSHNFGIALVTYSRGNKLPSGLTQTKPSQV